MKLVIFGLTVSSSWGNGHATLWRGMVKALSRRGHHVVFFERDVPYYATTRDLTSLPQAGLMLYSNWDEVMPLARRELADADVAVVSSHCPDGVDAAALLMHSGIRVKAFYDLDTPITLQRLNAGESLPYIPRDGLAGFDLVLSYTGGRALDALRQQLGAKHVVPLYGHVDPEVHRPVAPADRYRCDLSYLGTYAPDRQPVLQELFATPARQLPPRRFVIGGLLYPADLPWTGNIHFVQHVPPGEHPAFFSSSRLTLNVTHKAMAEMGYCPSRRLFEASACGAAMISDGWEGLQTLFTPGQEILIARSAADTIAAMQLSDAELSRLARNGRERVLSQHTADHRAKELEQALEQVNSPSARHREMAVLRSLQSTGFPFAITEGEE